MIKVAIKHENITSFGGIYHIMDVFFSSWGLRNSPSQYSENAAAAARLSAMEASSPPFSSPIFAAVNALRT